MHPPTSRRTLTPLGNEHHRAIDETDSQCREDGGQNVDANGDGGGKRNEGEDTADEHVEGVPADGGMPRM